MNSFTDKIAVVTGGGDGIGRETVRLLVAEGCHVATADVSPEGLRETVRLAVPRDANVRLTTHVCDVSDEAQVLAFRDEVVKQHAADHVDLLFNNAGISGGASFVRDPREQWDRTFAVCWYGVYYCSRAFLPLLIASREACLVNTSSMCGLRASLGPQFPASAYSTAKFAVHDADSGKA